MFQVRVLELESQLEKERKRLGDLRRTHYQLAGASEGWEEVSIVYCPYLTCFTERNCSVCCSSCSLTSSFAD